MHGSGSNQGFPGQSAAHTSSGGGSGSGAATNPTVTPQPSGQTAAHSSGGGRTNYGYGSGSGGLESSVYSYASSAAAGRGHSSGDGSSMYPEELEQINPHADAESLADALERFNDLAAIRGPKTSNPSTVKRALSILQSLQNNGDEGVRESACRVIATLALEETARPVICSEGGVRLLLTLCGNDEDRIATQTARAISQLSNSPRSADCLRDDGALQFLLKVIGSSVESLADWASQGLKTAVSKSEQNAKWVSRRGLAPLCALLGSAYVGVRENAILSLRLLVKNETTMDPTMDRPELVRGLMSAIKDAMHENSRIGMEALGAALDAAATCIRDEETATAAMQCEEGMLSEVVSSQDQSVKNHSIDLIASIMNYLPGGSTSLAPLLTTSGVIEEALSSLDMELSEHHQAAIARSLGMLIPLVMLDQVQETFVERGGPSKLGKMINTSFSSVRELAIVLAAKFATYNAGIAAQIATSGALSFVTQALPFLITSRPSPAFDPEKEILLNCRLLNSLIGIVYEEPCFRDESFVTVIKNIMHSPTEETVVYCTNILAELLCHDASRNTVVRVGGIGELLGLVRPDGGAKTLAAARALSSVGKSERGAQELVEANGVNVFINCLSNDACAPGLKAECTRAISSMAAQDSMLQSFMKCNGMEAVISLLFSDNITLKEAGLDFFMQVSPDPALIDSFVKGGGLLSLVGTACAADGDVKLRAKALNVACQLSVNREFRKQLSQSQELAGSIGALVSDIQGDAEFVAAALRTFGFLCVDPSFVESFLTEEVLQAIVTATSMGPLQASAIQCIVRVSECADDAWSEIVKVGGIQLLMTMFNTTDSRAVNFALSGLQSCSTDVDMREHIAKVDIFAPRIVSHVIDGDAAAQIMAAEILSNMCQDPDFLVELKQLGERVHLPRKIKVDNLSIARPLLKTVRLLIKGNDERVLEAVLERLDSMTSFIDIETPIAMQEAVLLLTQVCAQSKEGKAAVLDDMTVTRRLIGLVPAVSPAVQSQIMSLLALLAEESSFSADSVLDKGGSSVIYNLMQSGKAFLEKPALELVANLTSKSEVLPVLESSGIANVLFSKISHLDLSNPSSSRLCKAVASLIVRAKDSEEKAKELVGTGAISNAVKAVTDRDDNAMPAAISLLASTATLAPVRTEALKEGLLEPFLDFVISGRLQGWDVNDNVAAGKFVSVICSQSFAMSEFNSWGGFSKAVENLNQDDLGKAAVMLHAITSLSLKGFAGDESLAELPKALVPFLSCGMSLVEKLAAKGIRHSLAVLEECADVQEVLEALVNTYLNRMERGDSDRLVAFRAYSAIEELLLFPSAREGVSPELAVKAAQRLKTMHDKNGSMATMLKDIVNKLRLCS